jgi:hypothetical protein
MYNHLIKFDELIEYKYIYVDNIYDEDIIDIRFIKTEHQIKKRKITEEF